MSQAAKDDTRRSLEQLGMEYESLTEKVFVALQDAIVSGELQSGDRVTEAGLATRLRVSKTPVREALLRLQHMGLVQVDGRRSGHIVKQTPGSISHAYEVREALEGVGARLACSRASASERDAIADSAEASLRAALEGNYAVYRSWGMRFHNEVMVAAGNPRLRDLAHNAAVLSWALRHREDPLGDDAIECAKHHVDIAEAIGLDHADVAEDTMRRHIVKIADMQLDALTVASFP